MTAAAKGPSSVAGRATEAQRESPLRFWRVLFFATLTFWVLYPIVIAGDPAQDTVPYVVAGELASSHPGAIYPEKTAVTDLTPPFRERSCELLGSEELCARVAGPFVSPPPAIPFAVALSWAGDAATRLVRILAGLCLVGAMAIAWRQITARNSKAEAPLALAALCLSPLMFRPIDLGQTSPLLLLVVVLPLALRDRPRGELVIGAALGVAIVIKAFPAALLVVPLVSRRFRQLISATSVVVACSVGALLISGWSAWRDYLRVSSAFTRYAQHDLNGGSIDAALSQLGVDSSALVVIVRLALLAGVLALARRHTTYLARWALGWAALLVVLPHALNHYLFAGFGAVVVALVVAGASTRQAWLLMAAAGATLPVALIDPGGDSFPVLLLLTNVALFAVVAVLVSQESRPAAGALVV